MFKSASESAYSELAARSKARGQVRLSFGVEFLDDALRGIFPDDLILIGAPSGVGKTQLCCNIAMANLLNDKKVHYIALEASEQEIERRIKYQFISDKYFGDPNRPRLDGGLNFPDWLMGKYIDELKYYEEQVAEFFEDAFKNLFILYKKDRFGVNELIESILYCADETDLILIDHVHYFDFDDDNENRAIKEIAKTVRSLALEQQKPIILVAHLRKRDKHNEELVAGLEEFHGSSDLYKIATKVITMAPGGVTPDHQFETFFRIPKNRIDGGVTRFMAREFFSSRKGIYEKGLYRLGWADQKRIKRTEDSTGFELIDEERYPAWAQKRGPIASSSSNNNNAPWKQRTDEK